MLSIADVSIIPKKYRLYDAYPNPFNPTTILLYDLPQNSMVTITIYDILGRAINTIVNEVQDAGYQSIIWDATNDYGYPVSAGVYLYQIETNQYTQTKKVILLN